MLAQSLSIIEAVDLTGEVLKEWLSRAVFIQQGLPAAPRSILELPQLKIYYEEWGTKPNDLAFVARKHETPGLVWGRMHSGPLTGFGFVDGETPEISIAVREGFRNQGIGTQLLASISKSYEQLGVKKLSLSVDRHNPAKALYLRDGFLVIEENQNDFIMEKLLRVPEES